MGDLYSDARGDYVECSDYLKLEAELAEAKDELRMFLGHANARCADCVDLERQLSEARRCITTEQARAIADTYICPACEMQGGEECGGCMALLPGQIKQAATTDEATR
jgi:hypothetical protein